MEILTPTHSEASYHDHRTVLFVGQLEPGSTTRQRVCALEDLGFRVVPIDVNSYGPHYPGADIVQRIRRRLQRPADFSGANRQILRHLATSRFHMLWLDKALCVSPQTIVEARRMQPDCRIIGYSPDDMSAGHNHSAYFIQSLPLLDQFITTKSFNVAELQELGCRRVTFVDNGYDPHTHRPYHISPEERQRLGGAVGFVGTYEVDRCKSMWELARAGIPVDVYGNGWERAKHRHSLLRWRGPAQYGALYARLCCAFDINLCFLRKLNRDLQTQRSVEIPACGAFMLAERTEEHLSLFREGKEAEFFASDIELIAKVQKYLSDTEARQRIAEAGRNRCIADGYSYAARIINAIQSTTAVPKAAA